MTVCHEEKVAISQLPPKRYPGCPIQIAAGDRKLRSALLAEFNDNAIADRVMRVIKGERG